MRSLTNLRLIASTALLLTSCTSPAHTIYVSIPTSAPSHSQQLSPTLFSLSIEQDRWPEWAGIDARNEFTYNALQNYAALTGEPPSIRIGGDSADHTFWSPSVDFNQATFPPPTPQTPYPEATRVLVGDGFYTLARFLPRGTRTIWGLNLGADDATNAADTARAIVRAFRSPRVAASGVALVRLEVGNEPDIYNFTGLRPGDWTPALYVEQWTESAGAVVNGADIRGRDGAVSLQGASFGTKQFTPREVFDLGLLDSAPGKAVSIISQHRYSVISSCNGTAVSLADLMSKEAVRSNLTIFKADIAASKARGLRYVIGETNSAACHGASGVSNTAGAALWAIDYVLQAASLGVQELYFHEGVGYLYNLFQSIPLNRSTTDGSPLDPPQKPHVQPLYYAGLVIGSFIGHTGDAEIVELQVDSQNVSAYTAYVKGALNSAVFVNLEPWLSGATGPRPAVHLDLDFTGGVVTAANSTAVVRRLTIEHADDLGGLLWAGQSYETPNAMPDGAIVEERETVQLGRLELHASASEAIVVSFM
ncbi:glycoside hydrolase family 79 protein [Trametes elegans]|nr:glycoside hydrolase family 79 protein [Trametes elegans]